MAKASGMRKLMDCNAGPVRILGLVMVSHFPPGGHAWQHPRVRQADGPREGRPLEQEGTLESWPGFPAPCAPLPRIWK